MRRESRGLHYTLDYPLPDESKPPSDTLLVPKTAGRGTEDVVIVGKVEQIGVAPSPF
jgi:L-aspartate oxidase